MGDYFGSNGYLTGLGFRKKGPRPVTNEFSKSMQLDELEDEEYFYDEYGVRHRKKDITSLEDISVEEISLVSKPATRKKFFVVKSENKGDDKGMITLKPSELKTVRETISILGRYELDEDLTKAKEVLISNFGTLPGKYPYPSKEVKKYNDKIEWTTVQNQLYGYTEDDLSMVSESDIYEIEKSNSDTKWPSLSGQFNRNKRVLEERWEERNIEARAI